MLSTTSAPSLSRRSATKTIAAPSRPNSRAVAAPMPLAAPLIRATLSFMRIGVPPFLASDHLEPDDPGNDERDRADAQGRCRIAEQQDARDKSADRADAGPYGVRGAHRNGTLRGHEQGAAHGHANDREQQPPDLQAAGRPALLEPE